MTKVQQVILVSAMGMGLCACTPSHSDQYTIEKWKAWSGYKGDVCMFPSVEDGYRETGKLLCINGVKLTMSSINAGQAYLIWVGCEKYKQTSACTEMTE